MFLWSRADFSISRGDFDQLHDSRPTTQLLFLDPINVTFIGTTISTACYHCQDTGYQVEPFFRGLGQICGIVIQATVNTVDIIQTREQYLLCPTLDSSI